MNRSRNRTPAPRLTANGRPDKSKSLESWIWDAACSIRGAKDAPKYKDYILSRVLQPEPGMEIYDPTCGSGGLLIKCEIAMEERINSLNSSPSPPAGERDGVRGHSVKYAPLKLYGQEYIADTWAMPSVEDPRNPRFNSHEYNPDHF